MAKAQVTFISTTLAALGNIPLVNGQIIALRDADLCYYDMLFENGDGTTEVQRRPVARMRKVSQLPDVADIDGLEETMFIVVGETTGIYMYDAGIGDFIPLSRASVMWTDFNPHDIPDPPAPTGSDLTNIANLIIRGSVDDTIDGEEEAENEQSDT